MQHFSGYSGMSDVGRRVCEFVEAATRVEVERNRMRVVPTHEVPPELLKLVKDRYSSFTEAEKAAVVDLRMQPQIAVDGRGRPRWDQWLRRHLASAPADAVQLSLLESDFGGAGGDDGRTIDRRHLRNFGVHDFNWKMPW